MISIEQCIILKGHINGVLRMMWSKVLYNSTDTVSELMYYTLHAGPVNTVYTILLSTLVYSIVCRNDNCSMTTLLVNFLVRQGAGCSKTENPAIAS